VGRAAEIGQGVLGVPNVAAVDRIIGWSSFCLP